MKSDIVRPDPIMRQIEYSSPLAFAEGLFSYYELFSQKKKDLEKICCRYIQDDLEE